MTQPALEERVAIDARFAGIEERLASLGQKMDRNLHWTVGIVLGAWVSSLGTTLAALLLRA
jgi:hypothetical protein